MVDTFHFVSDKTDHRKHAEIIADNLVNCLMERNLGKQLKAIGGGSTNINTGRRWCDVMGGKKIEEISVDCMRSSHQ